MSDSHTFTTADGRTVTIRPIRADDDAPLLVDLWQNLSDRTKRLRFHAFPRHLPPDEQLKRAVEMTHLMPGRDAALVAAATVDGSETIVGVARLSRSVIDKSVAEAAVVVRDDFQKVGLGTHLLQSLDVVAKGMGITKYEAWVLSENKPVIDIINKFGYPTEMETSHGETHVLLDIFGNDEAA